MCVIECWSDGRMICLIQSKMCNYNGSPSFWPPKVHAAIEIAEIHRTPIWQLFPHILLESSTNRLFVSDWCPQTSQETPLLVLEPSWQDSVPVHHLSSRHRICLMILILFFTSTTWQALKGVCRYLHKTKSWGMIFWHPKTLSGLPPVTFNPINKDPALPHFPSFNNNLLYAFMDMA